MIPVDEIFRSVKEISKAQAGAYVSGLEFNAQSKRAESLLFEYRLSMYRQNRADESLDVFKKTAMSIAHTGQIPVPADFRSQIDFEAVVVPSSGPQYGFNLNYIVGPEVSVTTSSPIRKGSLKKKRGSVWRSGSTFKIDPVGISYCRVTYFRNPVFAVWGYTTDPSQFIENYDATASTHYEWGEQDRSNLVDILLYLRGLQINDSQLINFLNNKIVLQK